MKKHNSWLQFEPKEGENLQNSSNYYERIGLLNCEIPVDVIHQWIFPLYYDQNSHKNYSWIDLNEVKFNLEEYENEFFDEINIIEENREMVNNYPENKFAPWHRKYWRKEGTWEVPPIIIDVSEFIEGKPPCSEIMGTYQLVEGHNRLGTLKLLLRIGLIPLANKHKVYVLSKK